MILVVSEDTRMKSRKYRLGSNFSVSLVSSLSSVSNTGSIGNMVIDVEYEG